MGNFGQVGGVTMLPHFYANKMGDAEITILLGSTELKYNPNNHTVWCLKWSYKLQLELQQWSQHYMNQSQTETPNRYLNLTVTILR